MLRDVIEGLTASIAMIDTDGDEWACLGLVDSRAEIALVEEALGSRYEVLAEPFEESIAIAGGPKIRSTSEVIPRILAKMKKAGLPAPGGGKRASSTTGVKGRGPGPAGPGPAAESRRARRRR